MTVNATRPDPVEGSVEEQVAWIIEQAQAQGLQLTGAGRLLPDMIKQAVEAALHAEMTDHLGYEKHAAEGRGSGNSRNGLTSKTVQTTAGPVDLDVPRDRNGTFDPVTVPKGTRRLTGFDDMIISLYAKGMTTRDIAEHLTATYGANVSHETIANITDAINEQVKEWRNRPLDEVYPIVYVDAIRLRIRDGGAVRIKACHLAVGVDVDGVKRVLGMWIEQTEGARFWMQVMTELRNRGIKVLLILPGGFFFGGIGGVRRAIEGLIASQEMYVELMLTGGAGLHYGHSVLNSFHVFLGMDFMPASIWAWPVAIAVVSAGVLAVIWLRRQGAPLWRLFAVVGSIGCLAPPTSTDYKLLYLASALLLLAVDKDSSTLRSAVPAVLIVAAISAKPWLYVGTSPWANATVYGTTITLVALCGYLCLVFAFSPARAEPHRASI